jgi:hypothetical protein
MTTQSSNPWPNIPAGAWIAIAALLLAGALIFHAAFPRYEVHVIGDGHAMVIYDRWGGRFQRANYDDRGQGTLTNVLSPF